MRRRPDRPTLALARVDRRLHPVAATLPSASTRPDLPLTRIAGPPPPGSTSFLCLDRNTASPPTLPAPVRRSFPSIKLQAAPTGRSLRRSRQERTSRGSSGQALQCASSVGQQDWSVAQRACPCQAGVGLLAGTCYALLVIKNWADAHANLLIPSKVDRESGCGSRGSNKAGSVDPPHAEGFLFVSTEISPERLAASQAAQERVSARPAHERLPGDSVCRSAAFISAHHPLKRLPADANVLAHARLTRSLEKQSKRLPDARKVGAASLQNAIVRVGRAADPRLIRLR